MSPSITGPVGPVIWGVATKAHSAMAYRAESRSQLMPRSRNSVPASELPLAGHHPCLRVCKCGHNARGSSAVGLQREGQHGLLASDVNKSAAGEGWGLPWSRSELVVVVNPTDVHYNYSPCSVKSLSIAIILQPERGWSGGTPLGLPSWRT